MHAINVNEKTQARRFTLYGLPVPSTPEVTFKAATTTASPLVPCKSPTQELLTTSEGESSDSRSSGSSPDGLKKQEQKKQQETCPCRCCGKLLSGTSNRRRHEKRKHPEFTPGSNIKRAALVDRSTGAARQVVMAVQVQPPIRTSIQPTSAPALSSSAPPSGKFKGDAAMDLTTDEEEAMIVSQKSTSEDSSPVECTEESPMSDIDNRTESDDDDVTPGTPPQTPSSPVVMEVDPLESSATQEPERKADDVVAPLSPRLIPEEMLTQVTTAFLHWLSMPPMSPIEAMVKARRAKSEAQLKPIRHNLRFLFVTLWEQGLIHALETMKLEVFQEVHICEALLTHLSQRQVRGARIYALFLLIKKILVYLASERSMREKKYLPPTLIASFVYVDSICADASEQRKRAAQNKYLLGGATVPGTSAASAHVSTGKRKRDVLAENEQSPENNASSLSPMSVPLTSSAASSAYASEPLVAQDGTTLTKQEMSTIAAGCLGQLEAFQEAFEESPSETQLRSMAQDYAAFLVTAILSLALAPRSQVLRELQVGKTLKKHSDGRYWAEIPAEMNKNRKPTMLTIPAELSPHLDFYLSHIRSAMLREAAASGISHNKLSHAYVFFKKSGEAPRPDFSGLTRSVTARLIGREVTAHAFRAGVITTYYEEGATQGQMDVLANLMAHDPSTARNYYYRPQFARAAAATNQEMTSLLLNSSRTNQAKRIKA